MDALLLWQMENLATIRHDPTLLGIPLECRKMILAELLIYKPAVRDPRQNDDPILNPVVLDITNSKLKLEHQVLRVCRQLYVEGKDVLYGLNYFRDLTSGVSMRFMLGMGDNRLKVRKFMTRIPMQQLDSEDQYGPPTQYMGTYMTNLNTALGDLLELTIVGDFFPGLGASDIPGHVSRTYRTMLYAAAKLTQTHSRLKTAIWLAESGGTWPRLKQTQSRSCLEGPQHLRHVRQTEEEVGRVQMTPNNRKAAENYAFVELRFFRQNRRRELRDRRRTELFPEPAFVMARDVVLDCPKIRETRWDKLLGKKAQDFARPDDAAASEY